jgi:hypothetical protein
MFQKNEKNLNYFIIPSLLQGLCQTTEQTRSKLPKNALKKNKG